MSDVDFPSTHKDFHKVWQAWRVWLIERGSEIDAPTNIYEVARFTSPQGVAIVYCNKKGTIKRDHHWHNGAAEAWIAFQTSASWRAGSKANRKKQDRHITEMLRRDGNRCFYCDDDFTALDQMTREHFVSITHGGPNRVENMALVHFSCNAEVGHKPVTEKILYAIRRRAETAAKRRNQNSEQQRTNEHEHDNTDPWD